MTRQQRTVFGEVAETYDDVRPSYPDELLDRLIDLVGLGDRARVLDIGCGTGLLAASFVARGHRVLGIEPSADMARVARRKFTGNLDFRLHLVDFHAWSPGQERFDLAVAGQSWHWMDPETRFAHASRALRDDGHLALVWNAPEQGTGPLRDAMDAAYLRHAPELYVGPPGSKSGLGGADPGDEIRADPHFRLLDELAVPWSRDYDTETYARLLSTQSNHRLLDPSLHAALLADIGAAVDGVGGGSITVDYVCRAFVAART